MFGLDDQIAGLGDGAAFAIVAAVAILLGLRHATDPDHLTAVTTLVAGDQRDARGAGRLGLAWGLGHATTLFAVRRADRAVPLLPARPAADGRRGGRRRRHRRPRRYACWCAGAAARCTTRRPIPRGRARGAGLRHRARPRRGRLGRRGRAPARRDPRPSPGARRARPLRAVHRGEHGGRLDDVRLRALARRDLRTLARGRARRWACSAWPSGSGTRSARWRRCHTCSNCDCVLLLFDIDGTLLLNASREHADSLHAALKRVHRIHELPGRVEAAGRTDGEIARSICLLAGIDAERIDERMGAARRCACEDYAHRCPPTCATASRRGSRRCSTSWAPSGVCSSRCHRQPGADRAAQARACRPRSPFPARAGRLRLRRRGPRRAARDRARTRGRTGGLSARAHGRHRRHAARHRLRARRRRARHRDRHRPVRREDLRGADAVVRRERVPAALKALLAGWA